MNGTLYLCATPIGNLGDISVRCLEIFNEVDLIAAEDTRRTIQLLNHFGISKPLTSYHEHNKREKGEYIINLLKQGKNVAQVSDAGTPAISDPGEDLVRLCIENDINVTSVPGPVAGINALILSGLSTRRYAFEGFLSVNKRHRREHLESVRNDTHTLIFYEAPHKLKYTLADMLDVFGGERRIALVRELTKLHEEVIRTTLAQAQSLYTEKQPRGEYVIVIEGADEKSAESDENIWEGISVIEHVEKYIAEGMTSKDAIKRAAKDRGLAKRDVYNEYHKGASENEEE
ncbi:MAG: 16S rRNA (cytidine(1402)-2'-O)-methyltransferase [Oscillospiraceae bacterium]|nr:16S rRNA (cytidine(1402)-2'-O)-methyltransferase [Oscillospiraceae bacterium]